MRDDLGNQVILGVQPDGGHSLPFGVQFGDRCNPLAPFFCLHVFEVGLEFIQSRKVQGKLLLREEFLHGWQRGALRLGKESRKKCHVCVPSGVFILPDIGPAHMGYSWMMVVDSLNRPVRSLRLSVTDRCNFRCTYCNPRDGRDLDYIPHSQILAYEEMERLVRIFISLGVRKVRLTGGEPLIRRDLPSLVAQLRRIPGLHELALTTNGSLLEEQALLLKEAGLDRITVSLDSLDPERFHRLVDANVPLEKVLRGIAVARKVGFYPIKLNCVMQRGVNEQDILPLADFARREGHTLRFIEFMDAGTGNDWRLDRVVPASELARRIGEVWPLEQVPSVGNAVAQDWRYLDGAGEIGLIASVTEPFCRGCDRARLSAAGSLYTCLFAAEGMSLRNPMRAGASDEELTQLVIHRWGMRDDRYSECRSELTEHLPRVEMHQIGG
jgi:cyclic pyranopterin phosphate synthase